MSNQPDVWGALTLIMQTLKQQAEFAVRTHARLVALRKAIALLDQNPNAAEERIRKFEEEAEKILLSQFDFAQSDVLLQLLKMGKTLNEHDA